MTKRYLFIRKGGFNVDDNLSAGWYLECIIGNILKDCTFKLKGIKLNHIKDVEFDFKNDGYTCLSTIRLYLEPDDITASVIDTDIEVNGNKFFVKLDEKLKDKGDK